MHILKIQNSQPDDVDLLLAFYEMAIAHQKKVSNQHWDGFSQELIESEIAEKRQYKITVDGDVACIFMVAFHDPVIWAGRSEDSIYIHRIVTHPKFRGFSFVKEIIKWAKQYAQDYQLQYIRMDTWADNEKLFRYYTGCGFAHVGTVRLDKPENMPKHYDNIRLSLFEMKAV